MTSPERTIWNFPVGRRPETPNGTFSPNQCNEWRDCGRCYYEARVRRVPKPASIHFAIGGGVHRSAEIIGQKVLAGEEVIPDEVLAACEQEFDSRTSAPEEEGTELLLDLGKYSDYGPAKDDTMRFARVVVERLPKLFRERGLIAVEVDLADLPPDMLRAAFPFPVRGRIDHVYGTAESATGSTDLKTSSRSGGPDENAALQFCWYALPAHMGGAEWRVGVDILAKLVTPKMDTYWANGTGHITDEQFRVAREHILDVADHISAGDFPIGKGWNGRHNYEHGLPAFSLAVSGFEAA